MVNGKRLIHASWLMKQISFTIVRSNTHLLLKFEKGGHETKEFNKKTPMDANESNDKTDTHFNPIWSNGLFVTKWSRGTKKPWWDASNWRSGARKKNANIFLPIQQWRSKELWTAGKKQPQVIVNCKFFSLALGSSLRSLTPPQQSFTQKRTHFQPFFSKFNIVWVGGGGGEGEVPRHFWHSLGVPFRRLHSSKMFLNHWGILSSFPFLISN